MSLDLALQSVAFYVLSCSTCAKIKHRRKAKLKAKKERAEKEKFETEQPDVYRHPAPFSTNSYWTEEIMMGPGPPKQKQKQDANKKAPNTGNSDCGESVGAESSLTDVPEKSRISGEGWNRKRYQREDEDLWGRDILGQGQKFIDAIAKAGSLLESRLNRSSTQDGNPASFYLAKNPPVNDLHPPVVSTQPASLDEVSWMLQPPPPAKVMEGKERVNRNRAGSSSCSSQKTQEGISLGGSGIGESWRKMDAPKEDTLSTERRRRKQRLSKDVLDSFTKPCHERGGSSSSSSSERSGGTMKRNKRPPPISIMDKNAGSSSTIKYQPIRSNVAEIRKSSSKPRPLLPTIMSSSNVIPQVSSKVVAGDLENQLVALQRVARS